MFLSDSGHIIMDFSLILWGKHPHGQSGTHPNPPEGMELDMPFMLLNKL